MRIYENQQRKRERKKERKERCIKKQIISNYLLLVASSSPAKFSKIVFPVWNFEQSLKLYHKNNFYQSLRITRNRTFSP